MKKESRSERLLKKYRAIRNSSYDSKLASKYKHYSEERIYKELGIKIPKKIPSLKPIPKNKRTISKAKRRIKKYQYAREEGLSPQESRKLIDYSRKKIYSTRQYLEEKKKTEKTPIKLRNILKSVKYRSELWSEWSRKDSLPPFIKHLAEKLNRNTSNKSGKLDDTDKYGYALAHYIFTEGVSEEQARKRYRVDRYDGDKYRDLIRKL